MPPSTHWIEPGSRPSARWQRMNSALLFFAASMSRRAYISPPIGWVSSQIFS